MWHKFKYTYYTWKLKALNEAISALHLTCRHVYSYIHVSSLSYILLTVLVSSVVCGEDDSIAVDRQICAGLEIELNDTPISKLVLGHRERETHASTSRKTTTHQNVTFKKQIHVHVQVYPHA